MTGEQQRRFNELADIAARYRAVHGPQAQDEQSRLAREYAERLAQLHGTGWAGSLGEGNELPDALMPGDYLERRARTLRDLEHRLGELAAHYRDSRTDAQETRAIEDYRATLEEMYRIGHWSGMPDPDSELPDRLMPPAYHAHRQRLIAEFQAQRTDPASG